MPACVWQTDSVKKNVRSSFFGQASSRLTKEKKICRAKLFEMMATPICTWFHSKVKSAYQGNMSRIEKKKNFENFIKFYTNLTSFTSFSHSWNGRKGSSPRRFRNTSRFSPTSNSSAKSTSKIYQARSRCIHAICRPGSLLWNILVALLNHRSRVSLFEGELAWIQGFWNFTSEGAFCRLAIRRKFYVKILFVPLVLEVAIFRSMCKIHDHRWRLEEQNRGVWKLYFSDSYKGLKKLEDMCP